MEGPIDGRRGSSEGRRDATRRSGGGAAGRGRHLKERSTTCTSAASRPSWAAARRRSPSSTSAGKLTARERIDLLVDEGTFVEMGIHGRPHFSQRAMEGKEAPADGVVTGWGDVDGRPSRSPPTTSR